MIEKENSLVGFLKYHTSVKDNISKNIPSFEKQLELCDKSITNLRKKFEEIQHRESYKDVIGELTALFKKAGKK